MTKDKLLKLKRALEDNKEAFESLDEECGSECLHVKPTVECGSNRCVMLRLDAKIGETT